MTAELICGACGKRWLDIQRPTDECPFCGYDGYSDRQQPTRRLTTQERQQEMADRGIDTWEDYRGEK